MAEPLEVEVIAYVLGSMNHCSHCQVFLDGVGVGGEVHQAGLESYREDLRQDGQRQTVTRRSRNLRTLDGTVATSVASVSVWGLGQRWQDRPPGIGGMVSAGVKGIKTVRRREGLSAGLLPGADGRLMIGSDDFAVASTSGAVGGRRSCGDAGVAGVRLDPVGSERGGGGPVQAGNRGR